MRYFLIGHKGSGKTTMGKMLANKLGYPFIDLDHIIENISGKAVPDFFREVGETNFRKTERQALEGMSKFNNVVIATGGGAPCFADNMQLMKQLGITIYLKVADDILLERYRRVAAHRPIFGGCTVDELPAYLEKVKAERNPFYEQADHTIEGRNLKMEDFSAIIG